MKMKREKMLLAAAAILCAAAVFVLIYVLTVVLPDRTARQEFVPPAFESAVQVGEPQPPEELGYTSVSISDGYMFGICSAPILTEDRQLQVWFSSPADNQVWMRLQVCGEGDSVLGETGVIKPGEYVEYVELTGELPAKETVVYQITGYTPESWHSAGNAELPVRLTRQMSRNCR